MIHHILIILSEAGPLLYRYSANKSIKIPDQTLISGYITALKHFGTETLGKEARLISFDDKVMAIATNGKIDAVAIVDRNEPIKAIQTLLKDVIDYFWSLYGKVSDIQKGRIEVFTGFQIVVKDLLKKYENMKKELAKPEIDKEFKIQPADKIKIGEKIIVTYRVGNPTETEIHLKEIIKAFPKAFFKLFRTFDNFLEIGGSIILSCLLKPKQILTATVELEAKKTGEAIFEPKIKYVIQGKTCIEPLVYKVVKIYE